MLADHLPEWGFRGQEADIAILLTSELVTNAIQHSRGPVVLEAAMAPSGRLRVEISDADASAIQPGPAPLDSDHGRGLYLVDALADAWGADRATTGKRVWFELTGPQTAQ